MKADLIKALAQYNNHANSILLREASKLTASQLGPPLPIPDLIVQFVDQSGQTWRCERA